MSWNTDVHAIVQAVPVFRLEVCCIFITRGNILRKYIKGTLFSKSYMNTPKSYYIRTRESKMISNVKSSFHEVRLRNENCVGVFENYAFNETERCLTPCNSLRFDLKRPIMYEMATRAIPVHKKVNLYVWMSIIDITWQRVRPIMIPNFQS